MNDPAGERPRTYIQQTRRAQLIGCAIEVLAEVGYAQASMVRIAERAGVSRGVISYHFTDRDDLIGAVVTEVYSNARAILLPRIEAAPTAADSVRAFIVGSAQFYRDWPDQMAALHAIYLNGRIADGAPSQDHQGAADDEELTAVAALLARGQADGEFRDFAPRVMARSIRHALNGLFLDMRTDPEFDVAADAEELATLFARATERIDTTRSG